MHKESTVHTAAELANDFPHITQVLDQDGLVVLPTDTVYGIGCDPFSAKAVRDLLAAKGRGETMPPPVLAGTTKAALDLADGGAGALEHVHTLADAFWPGPLTLIVPTTRVFGWDTALVGGTVAVRVPANDAARIVLDIAGPLAVTSANLTGQSPALTVDQAISYFGQAVSCYVDDGPSQGGTASTILDCTADTVRIVRAGALHWEEIERVLEGVR